ncbi:MAG: ChaN family lipoprotein [Spirosomataceae bacterium]
MKHLLFLLTVLGLVAFTPDKPAYLLYDQSLQKTVSYESMIKKLADADVVFFGEEHDNPVCHWLQFEVAKDLFAAKKNDFLIGAEMFEADNQLVLDEYLKGQITAKQLEDEAKIWNNYATDYKPLVEFAKANKIPFVATNIPRRYASLVSKSGLQALENLSDDAKKNIAPLPFDVDLSLPGYKNMMDMGGMHGGSMGKMNPEVLANMARAQGAKDATMAYFILKNWQKGKLLLHLDGHYHSDNFDGIVSYLKKQKPDLKIMTITNISEDDITQPKEAKPDMANFVLITPKSLTRTYLPGVSR